MRSSLKSSIIFLMKMPTHKPMELSGKVAIVTGGSQGIGKAIAQIFLENGASVIVFDLKQPDYNVTYQKVDIREAKEVEQAFKGIPKLDILVNNAGIYFQATVEQTSVEGFDNMIATNLRGPFLMCKHALPLLRKSKGTIINISSGLGITLEPESAAYGLTKAGLLKLTRDLALQVGREGVRVNAILPGPIDTPLLRAAFPTEEALNQYAQSNPMRRIGTPQDVANVALFLASPKAGFVNGAFYAVGGGESQ